MPPAQPDQSLIDALAAAVSASGIAPRAWMLGLARATPAVTLVPAFGLSAVPPQTRLALGLCLGLCIAPALGATATNEGPLAVALVREAYAGLPVAILAALSMYIAGMAGGLLDDLRGSRDSVTLPNLPESLPPVAALFSLLASLAFLETGGAERVASALAMTAPLPAWSWAALVRTLASSVELALGLATPLVVASLVLEVASALIARAATPAFIAPVLAPLKSLALLAVLALVLERIAELLAILSRANL